jgi:alpha-tubulin suppressor-like RCC1 family protein
MGDLAPVAVGTTGERITQLSAGAYHTCALLRSGQVKCWGLNEGGQLGAGDTRTRGLAAEDMGPGLTPVALGSGEMATQISAGALHTCAVLRNGGRVKCWGSNDSRQLGSPARLPQGVSPQTLGDGLQPVPSPDGSDQFLAARSVSAGAAHTCALLLDDRVVCWGYGGGGQLGTGDRANRPSIGGDHQTYPLREVMAFSDLKVGTSRIATGGTHACLIQASRIYCWGSQEDGQLGTGDEMNRGNGVLSWRSVDLFGAGASK